MADSEQVARLRQSSIEEWNQWRLANPKKRIDLQNACFLGTYLKKADLEEANLGRADLEEANLRLADLTLANLEEANLTRAKLLGANLGGANLGGANLGKTDLAGAKLVRARLIRANLKEANLAGANLEEANLEEANLEEASLEGTNLEGTNLKGANLKGVNLTRANLEGANLARANLEGANLEGANLEGANLEGACLLKAQVLATYFEAATFTGACLKDWNTNRSTHLEGTKADYIYLGYNEDHFTDRRPHSSNFKPGDFAALFQQAIETLDLIFVDGIDWQAFVTAFQNLRQQYSDAELNIQAIENKGGSFVVRIEISKEMDKAAIEQAAKAGYEQQLQLLETRYQAQLQAKDAEIESHKRESANMLEITKLLASKPITVEASAVAENQSFNQTNHGGTNFQNSISSGEVNQAETINLDRSSITSHMQGAQSSNMANQLSGNTRQIYNTAHEKSLTEAAQEIQVLLDHLSEIYPSETVVEKAQLAEAAAIQTEANQSLKLRILNALDAGTLTNIGHLLNHPAATFFIETIEDWNWNQSKPNS